MRLCLLSLGLLCYHSLMTVYSLVSFSVILKGETSKQSLGRGAPDL